MAASENSILSNMAEDPQSSEHEPVDYGLDSVVPDVWHSTILPMLTVPAIFQLCGVNKKLRRMLYDEYTFKLICLFRYQLSPSLPSSYIQAAKVLYMATRIATFHHTRCESTRNCIAGKDYLVVLRQKWRMMVLLSSMARKPPSTLRLTPSPAGIPFVLDQLVTAYDASLCLPNVEDKDIHEQCRVRIIQDEFGVAGKAKYVLEEIVDLLFKRCGSFEAFQTAIIDYIEKDFSMLASYLPYLTRSWRLVELGKGFLTAKMNSPEWIPPIEETDLACLHRDWEYNPSIHWYRDYIESGVLQWSSYDIVADAATYHSAVELMMTGRLSTSQADDYFDAWLKYTEIWKSMPESTRPNLYNITVGLGSFLLPSSLLMSHSHKLWSKVELLHQMIRFGGGETNVQTY
ncbi:uncharacterized protein LOC135825111 [Sycon ciliatum]|uniref:uncharacterized protein LOC135825111 n=1 Tax=Sycon ciliatum TaxID=27933 RepID=UPI0031F69431